MKEKNIRIINLRAIAILIVLLGHSIIIYDNEWGIYISENTSSILETLKHIINVIQMPLFFSISGFCFFYSKKFDIKKKAKRLLIPFIVFFLFWVIPFRLISHYPDWQGKSVFYIIIQGLIGKDVGHLWYVIVLFEMFFIFNLIKKCDKKITILIHILFALCTLKTSLFPKILSLQMFFKYFIFFIIGYDLNKYNFKIKNKMCILGLIIVAVFFILYIFIDIKLKIIYKLLGIIIPFLLIVCLFNIMTEKKIKWLNYISKNSFGLYLLHSPMLYPIFYYRPNINIGLMITNNFIIIPLICLLIIKLIRRTRICLIIGEEKKNHEEE